jgi:flagellar hook-basal body complex protein FliE
MTVEPLEPDAPLAPVAPLAPAQPVSGSVSGPSFADALGQAFDAAGDALARAASAESAFVAGRGGLQEMVLERAQADVMLSIASATASRTAGALTTILGMQI